MSEILPIAPLIANQSFGTTLDGNPKIIGLRWNTRTRAWYMDLLATDETRIAMGMKLVIGAFIGIRYANPDMPGIFAVQDTSGQEIDAGLDDIGFDVDGNPLRVQLHYFTYTEVSEANG